MTIKPRYVFDTNTLISALLFAQSVPGQAFFAALQQGVILTSEPLLAEIQGVLGRKKFERAILATERERFLARLVIESILIEITTSITACRDPKDDKILELALSGRATCIVTGDNDLLVLNPFQNTPILNAAQFLAMLASFAE